MLEFLKRRLKSEKGAMDKILVTLLLVIVGIAAVVGLTTWMNGNVSNIEGNASSTISGILDANAS